MFLNRPLGPLPLPTTKLFNTYRLFNRPSSAIGHLVYVSEKGTQTVLLYVLKKICYESAAASSPENYSGWQRNNSFGLSVLHESTDSGNFQPIDPGSCYMELNERIRISCKVTVKIVTWVSFFHIVMYNLVSHYILLSSYVRVTAWSLSSLRHLLIYLLNRNYVRNLLKLIFKHSRWTKAGSSSYSDSNFKILL